MTKRFLINIRNDRADLLDLLSKALDEMNKNKDSHMRIVENTRKEMLMNFFKCKGMQVAFELAVHHPTDTERIYARDYYLHVIKNTLEENVNVTIRATDVDGSVNPANTIYYVIWAVGIYVNDTMVARFYAKTASKDSGKTHTFENYDLYKDKIVLSFVSPAHVEWLEAIDDRYDMIVDEKRAKEVRADMHEADKIYNLLAVGEVK